ncbi:MULTISPECIES: threonine/serine exporter family protein [unclassified Breznakia]|uniref:threonine/serine exporter family protein n=1 Tax=unclassified Breznakia TaxID=2623764 RepID=UPI002474EB7E|nr:MULTISPECIES: threonine/serine exporter family protein [unclassified Breznakia]MDH6367736.1 uncharacterized membrane protein YjjB (DUF3815 family) [Breznakia sp. PH1-1]MDH6404824.1 uncharacterized membrane protein YjjB (DUF3815 family) [Breznakia sp. PF1-11]MDH6412550.1 uncharacterized membrane protein YjjB (DUF3815 family) [Breznakia sp. PFB1-11]MDH6414899.1 uncharacterized membrane protein YjjB (DUF3815 family) [Breznakia sp. PFB1-14]MDH6417221.1 uncharacterized membrane protein YjjB (DUF
MILSLVKIASAALSSFFFGVLFNIKKENLVYGGIGGAIGMLIYELCKFGQFSSASSMFLAAVGFATYSEIMARVRKTTVTTFVISSLIPLVPGGGMYETMLYVVNNRLDEALSTGLDTLIKASMLALGMLFVSSFSRVIKIRKSRIEQKRTSIL